MCGQVTHPVRKILWDTEIYNGGYWYSLASNQRLKVVYSRFIFNCCARQNHVCWQICCLGTPLSHFVQAGQPVYTKISCEYSTIKRSLRCRYIPRIQKISDAHTIKNRWLRTKTSAICADKNHIKMSVIKKRWLRIKTGACDVRVSCEYTIIKRWLNMKSYSCF